MKKVIIIGANGGLAKFVIKALQTIPDVELTLFVRNKTKLPKELLESTLVIEGDALKYDDLKAAISGQHIVYENLAGDLEGMTTHIVQAMENTGVKRIIAISSIGIYGAPLKSVLKPYRKLADIIEASKLDYTILRPDWFTNGNEIDYGITHKGEPEKGGAISRKSIAAFIAKLVENPELYIGENLGISKF
jgi:uncharacterized protein YbjT (DUF2867 family)